MKRRESIRKTNPWGFCASSSLAYLLHGRELSLLKKQRDRFHKEILKSKNSKLRLGGFMILQTYCNRLD